MYEERAIVRDALPSELLQLSSTGGPAALRCCCPIRGGQGYQFPSPQVLVTVEWDGMWSVRQSSHSCSFQDPC